MQTFKFEEKAEMKKNQFLIFISMILIISCSNEEGEKSQVQNSQSHVLETQIQALEKAKTVEQMLQKGANNRLQIIEEQSK